MSNFDLEALEKVVIETPVAQSADLSAIAYTSQVEPAETPEFASTRGNGVVSSIDIMSEEAFLEQWFMLHEMAGGMVHMRTGVSCPLGDQSRSEGGLIAGKAAYSLIKSNPALSRLMLSNESTFWGKMAAIGMHGFACVQIVIISRRGPTVDFDQQDQKEAA